MDSAPHASGAYVCTVEVSHQGASATGSGVHGSSRSAAADPAVASRTARQAAVRIILPRTFSRLSGCFRACELVSAPVMLRSDWMESPELQTEAVGLDKRVEARHLTQAITAT